MGEPDRERVRRQLLGWYREKKRDLPFRRTRDPYAILVAEIILQRTRVRAGLPYYERFLAAFPTVHALAAASEPDVMRAWEGLGFYRRAKNLHQAAKMIVNDHGGAIPAEYEALRALPGIGDYTAGAVGSIAFGLHIPAVDGNAIRVLSRVFRVEGDVFHGPGKRRIQELASDLVDADAPGTWNQAVMELGATVCVPRAPKCERCPIAEDCMAFAAGVQGEIPRTTVKPEVPIVPVVFAVVQRAGKVLLVRRREGLHEGLYGLPGGEVRGGETPEVAIRRHLAELGLSPLAVAPASPLRHAFSHLRWEGNVYRCEATGRPRGAEWVDAHELVQRPLIPLHRRLIDRAVS